MYKRQALYDNPKLAVMNKNKKGKSIMKGLYRIDRYQSPFCIPSKVVEAFTDLFNKTSKFKCPLLLSYSPYDKSSSNRPRLISIDELIILAGKFFSSVETIDLKDHKHRKLNKAQNNFASVNNGEILLLCKTIN